MWLISVQYLLGRYLILFAVVVTRSWTGVEPCAVFIVADTLCHSCCIVWKCWLYLVCIIVVLCSPSLDPNWIIHESSVPVSREQRDTSAQWSYKLVPHRRVIADRYPATAAQKEENGKRKNLSRVKARIRWDKEIEIPAWIPLRGGNYKSECQNVSLRSFVFSSAKLCLKSFPRSSFTCRVSVLWLVHMTKIILRKTLQNQYLSVIQ